MAIANIKKSTTKFISLFRRRPKIASGEELVGPIRGEVLGADRLAARARAVARTHRLADASLQPFETLSPTPPLLQRLDDTRLVLRDVSEALSEGANRRADISPAGEWLLDNYYIIQEHMREVRTNLPRGYYRELPKLATGPLANYPRVYEIAIELISHTEGHLDLDNITLFVSEYQRVAPLKVGELWAIPTMLRLALIENIRRMALRVRARLKEVDAADEWAAKLRDASEITPEYLARTLSNFVDNHPKLTPTFVARFLQQIRSYQTNFTPLLWLEQWIAEDGPSAEEAASRSNRRVALTQITVVNSITSLRMIASLDWKEFVEAQSTTEKILRQDPAGQYADMSFSTRDHYRHVVERLAKYTNNSEDSVARSAIALAGSQPESEIRKRHVGYWLIDSGRWELEREVQYKPRFGEIVHRWMLRHPNTVYFGGVALLTALELWLLHGVIGAVGTKWAVTITLLALIPLNDVAISLVNQLITAFLPPRILPKLDFRERGIPDNLRAAVVVPTLFPHTKAVAEALEHLEVQYLANRDPNLRFVLLSDFTDSKTQTKPEDAEILQAAIDGTKALNEKYNDVFLLFHRERLWNESQGVWMGWERKRGKLSQFNKFVRGERNEGNIGSAFQTIVGDMAALEGIRYVIVLDSDTVLPRDTAQTLVGTLAHPLNRAEYDEQVGRITCGYGILQPRMGVSLTSAHRSVFASIHSGHPGVDPYTTAVSDVYQDLYGEGSFAGKGIYDIDAFEAATQGKFPENTLLSHDLIEGTYARAGLTTDIELYDDYPTRYLTFTRRKHRWIRGDWQLLRWLGSSRLSAISRWKIFDNLRRSIVETSQMVLLITGWLFLPGNPWVWTTIVLLTVAAPWLFNLALAALRPPYDQSLKAYYAAIGRDAMMSGQQLLLAIIFLPHQAVVSADAIIRTLIRLTITKRNLLEWQTASQVERATGGSLIEHWRKMWVAPAVALVLLGLLSIVEFTLFGALTAVILITSWVLSPTIALSLSRPAIPGEVKLSDNERQLVLKYARLHWEFFEKFVTAETQWLAPDNFQEDPLPVIAMRTSPTNIGLQMLSIISAADMGFIGRHGMIEQLERVFRTLERMRRYKGHFYNWYDLNDLSVLEPAYISTVDSGNLAGHLIAVKQACLELCAKVDCSDDDRRRLTAMSSRAHAYAVEMDFSFLFDEKRKLFSIGFSASASTFDNSFYDLLASEARLASFIAIAKDDIPVENWFRLGRTLTDTAGTHTLISWSGSMFEYLMPVLVMQNIPLTLLDQTCRGAVKRQISYGMERHVPWGVSESAYNVRDRHQNYQYKGFGVPDLALKRGLSKELVIAPYATLLALMIEPKQALRNMAALDAEGALGPYGFRDAIDYTRPESTSLTVSSTLHSRKAVVSTYMAHHIGMSLVSLDNALNRQIWQRRFHSDPLVRSAELVLHERIPRKLMTQSVNKDDSVIARVPTETEQPAVREMDTPHTLQPRVALLGAVPFTSLITNAGGGYSKFENLAVTRWRMDATRDNYGQWCYVKDLSTGLFWSNTHQPVGVDASSYRAHFASDRVMFLRKDGDIETQTEIVVVAEEAAEVRRVTVVNHSTKTREIELTTYGEIVLASMESDRAHPAFGNLFVETEWLEQHNAILATRRPRSEHDRQVWAVHVIAAGHDILERITYETDRARFIGRGRSVRHPAALDDGVDLSRTTGAVLDPVFALRAKLTIPPGKSSQVSFTTLVAETRERALELADLYDDPYSARRALELSWAGSQAELRDMAISPADAALYQKLAGHLLYPHPGLQPSRKGISTTRGQQDLWALGISGDIPILLATIDSQSGIPSVRQLLQAHHYWRIKGVTCDLVILNRHPPTYMQELQDTLLQTVIVSTESALIDKPGGVFIRRSDMISADYQDLLFSIARVQIDCDGLGMGSVLEFPDVEEGYAPHVEPVQQDIVWTHEPRYLNRNNIGEGLAEFNGLGGFNQSGEYEIRLDGTALPPAPWANVIANENAGFCVTESGSGFTWGKNSYFFRLTPWHNDPVRDPSSECIYLRDEESGEFWSATPAPVREDTPYTVRHGAGYSAFEHVNRGIATELRMGMAQTSPVKISLLTIKNTSSATRTIGVTSYAEWVLGVSREQSQRHVRTRFDIKSQSIWAQNFFDSQFADQIAFLATSEAPHSYTADRREFLGRNGSPAKPAALKRTLLSEAEGSTIDPCGALQTVLKIPPGESREVVILLGSAHSEDAVRDLIERYRHPELAREELARFTNSWDNRLSTITVETPEPTFDLLVNKWMLYQALSCRMWARSALYQSSGAYGFRDQLQDCMAFCYSDPRIAREHIIRAAARQFEEGDVQHWWHPQSGRGVRTRFSDDLAWLPFVADHYVNITGDDAIWDEVVSYLAMRQLEPHEHEIYDLPQESSKRGGIYEHCLLALRKACTKGTHGLPLIGSGDWNDGMSRVGVEGKGESVWLGWFLSATLRKMAAHCDKRGDTKTRDNLLRVSDEYVQAIEKTSWDGEWYRRAYFDDGTPIGSKDNEECKIDSIAQSWSLISCCADADRARTAMQSLNKYLVREDERIIVLLDPPFDKMKHDPGYIKGYLPGVRENGAQYTHASLWAVLATTVQGDGDRAFALFQMLNPITHANTPERVNQYKVEPYVVAADVYTAQGHMGRGGWTWYTGSASWMYRVALESILGFTKRGDTLVLNPVIPKSWPGFKVTYRYGASTYHITVQRGLEVSNREIQLTDDGLTHNITVTLGILPE